MLHNILYCILIIDKQKYRSVAQIPMRLLISPQVWHLMVRNRTGPEGQINNINTILRDSTELIKVTMEEQNLIWHSIAVPAHNSHLTLAFQLRYVNKNNLSVQSLLGKTVGRDTKGGCAFHSPPSQRSCYWRILLLNTAFNTMCGIPH